MKIIQKISLFFIVLFFCVSIYGQKLPFDKFRLMYRGNPQSSAVIGWCGSHDVLFYYDTLPFDNQTEKYANKCGVSSSNNYKKLKNNFVRLENLNSGKRYYFILCDTISGLKSRMMSFKTLPDNASSLLIVAGGDSRNSVPLYEMNPKKCQKGRRDGNKMVSKIVPDVVLFGGDFVLNMFNFFRKSDWKKWLNDWQLTRTDDGLLIPIIPAMGNHEDKLDLVNIFDIIDSTSNFVSNLGGDLISVVTLNNLSNVCNPTQLSVTENLLREASTNSKWQMVQYHIPINPQGKKYNKREDLFLCWAPLFTKYGVDVISESHTHIIKTTYPAYININNQTFSRSDSNGIVFIGEGAWGAPLRKIRPDNNYIFDQKAYHGFHVLAVDRDKILIYQISFEDIDKVANNNSNRNNLELPANIKIKSGKSGNFIEIKK